ncbi:hypothetical protein B0H13DRAFT_1935200 [Mycena leptocephala]|nr:hypothetical protein B0H13DRAFT_1935200 [Mycena leptocephala]
MVTASDIIDDKRYLAKDFDPSRSTIPVLAGVLVFHGIQLPHKQRKPDLLALFKANITDRRVQLQHEHRLRRQADPSSDGILNGITGEPVRTSDVNEPTHSGRKVPVPGRQELRNGEKSPESGGNNSEDPDDSNEDGPTFSRGSNPSLVELSGDTTSENMANLTKDISRLRGRVEVLENWKLIAKSGWRNETIAMADLNSDGDNAPPPGTTKGKPKTRGVSKGVPAKGKKILKEYPAEVRGSELYCFIGIILWDNLSLNFSLRDAITSREPLPSEQAIQRGFLLTSPRPGHFRAIRTLAMNQQSLKTQFPGSMPQSPLSRNSREDQDEWAGSSPSEGESENSNHRPKRADKDGSFLEYFSPHTDHVPPALPVSRLLVRRTARKGAGALEYTMLDFHKTKHSAHRHKFCFASPTLWAQSAVHPNHLVQDAGGFVITLKLGARPVSALTSEEETFPCCLRRPAQSTFRVARRRKWDSGVGFTSRRTPTKRMTGSGALTWALSSMDSS